MKKRLLAALLACILCFALLPQVALADGTININKPISPPPGSGWSVSGSVVTITDGGNYTITGKTDTNHIEVKATDPVTITLDGVNIDVSKIDYAAALRLYPGADVTLWLEGKSVLKSGWDRAGIQAPAGTKLTIEGSGTLEAFGGKYGAGIGGGYGGDGGAITIADSATVTAFGGDGGAGIGGGYGGDGGSITIAESATVNATGGNWGAGIGGGNLSNGGTIKITGSADVKAYGGELGAGIGGGNLGNGGTITIAGSANVTAQGGEGAAGIGGGKEGNGEEITIQPGARVAATGGNGAYWPGYGATGGGAGIGGGGGWGDYSNPDQMRGGAPGNISLPEGRRGVTAKGGTGGMYGNIKAGNGADIGSGGDGANEEYPNGKDGEESFPLLPQRMVPTYTVKVTCLGPGASNIKAPREVDAGSILRVKLYPEEGAALLSLTVNGQTYDPALLKVEGEALIYGINRIDEDYELVAEFGEPFVVDVPEVEVTDPPKTGDAAASGGFFMLLALAVGVASMRRKMKNEE